MICRVSSAADWLISTSSTEAPCRAPGHQEHHGDQDHTVHRAGRRLGDLLGNVGHELDERPAEDRTADRRNAAHDQTDEEVDRDEDAEAVRRDELHHDGTE